jgi:hypothetical protein
VVVVLERVDRSFKISMRLTRLGDLEGMASTIK